MAKFLLSPVALLLALSCNSTKGQLPDDAELRAMAAQLLIVGFQGQDLTEDLPVYDYVSEVGVGGIILFDVNLCTTAKPGSRNIRSKQQLTKLISDIRAVSKTPLIVSIDQEGGRVSRLKEEYGFAPTVSAQYLGQVNQRDTTYKWAERTAVLLAEMGVNMNFAPSVDLNVNPKSPAIGAMERSFSGDVDVLVSNASTWIEAHNNNSVVCALKHFPGHGSAAVDSHLGMTDVTSTWTPKELEPYREMIGRGDVDMVMTAHVFNKKLDEKYPATLSKKILTGILRDELGFDGVIITDDMYMDAIVDHYSFEKAAALAINAGADMLCMGNNSRDGYAQERPAKAVEIIVSAVKSGEIPYERLKEAYDRVMKLKSKMKI